MGKQLPIALSNRHIHLNKNDLEILFGKEYNLTKAKDLSQLGQYACNEKLDIEGPRGSIKGVRVLGPTRDASQVEISVGDARTLGVEAVVRNSGDIDGTPGVTITGPKGKVELKQGVIVAARHIHMNIEDAEKFNVKDKDILKVRVGGDRALIFENVLVRVSKDFVLEMHVDIEEGNAAGAKNYDKVEVVD